ncbi:hypothetical protein E3Q14_04255 [Wallemia mellicola]|nr:hypothetical protein E3Q14_04255 [Wallemia mellicola]
MSRRWNLGGPVLVAGLSPISLVTLLVTRAAGAEPLIITELSGKRSNFATNVLLSIRTVLIENFETQLYVADKSTWIAVINLRLALECTDLKAVFTLLFSRCALVGKHLAMVTRGICRPCLSCTWQPISI